MPASYEYGYDEYTMRCIDGGALRAKDTLACRSRYYGSGNTGIRHGAPRIRLLPVLMLSVVDPLPPSAAPANSLLAAHTSKC